MNAKALFILLALAACASAADKVPVIKVKTEEPVLEEMMGGCSLKCAFEWKVEVFATPGSRAAAVKVLSDETALTAWTAGDAATGVGARFRISFPKKMPRDLEGTPFYGIDFINGYWKTEELWADFARLKKARLYYNDKPFKDLTFSDSRRWQRLVFDDVMVKSGDFLTIEVIEIYPGKTRGLALTELVLAGGH